MKTDSVNVRALCRAYDLGKAEGLRVAKERYLNADAYKEGIEFFNFDAVLDIELQRFAQWLWDNHYLIDEAFTIRLVEQYKSEQMKEQT